MGDPTLNTLVTGASADYDDVLDNDDAIITVLDGDCDIDDNIDEEYSHFLFTAQYTVGTSDVVLNLDVLNTAAVFVAMHVTLLDGTVDASNYYTVTCGHASTPTGSYTTLGSAVVQATFSTQYNTTPTSTAVASGQYIRLHAAATDAGTLAGGVLIVNALFAAKHQS